MSDSVLRLHAVDPDYTPDAATEARARAAAEAQFPGADRIDVDVYPRVTLIDCGENLVRIVCPSCGASIPTEWWSARMDAVAGAHWERADVDAPTPAPCCGEPVTLRGLIYDWPVGFARFTVDVWSPDPWPDGGDVRGPARALGDAIGVPLRGLWAYY